MRKIANTISLTLVSAVMAGPAFAGLPTNIRVPEPGMIGLFAAGAVAVILLKIRK
jgi:hypothetical protein